MQTKTCARCQVAKYLDQFREEPRNKGPRGLGRASYCVPCELEKSREFRKNHPEYQLRQDLRKHNLTIEQYEAMLAAQGGHCAICPATKPGGKGRWHVDHNHKTGKVRGLLCHYCNLLLGHAKDSVDILAAAIVYLRDHP